MNMLSFKSRVQIIVNLVVASCYVVSLANLKTLCGTICHIIVLYHKFCKLILLLLKSVFCGLEVLPNRKRI